MLEIVRGTTKNLFITITDNSGEYYTLQNGDKIIFGIKSHYTNSNYDIYKIADISNKQGENNYLISLSPADTINLEAGRYYYDVGLQTADGDYYMIIECDICCIKPAVTQKE